MVAGCIIAEKRHLSERAVQQAKNSSFTFRFSEADVTSCCEIKSLGGGKISSQPLFSQFDATGGESVEPRRASLNYYKQLLLGVVRALVGHAISAPSASRALSLGLFPTLLRSHSSSSGSGVNVGWCASRLTTVEEWKSLAQSSGNTVT